MNQTIRIKDPFSNEIELYRSLGKGAYPYDCRAKDKHPNSYIYVNDTGGGVASHQLIDTRSGYYVIR